MPSVSSQIAASADDARQQLLPGTVELTEAYVQVLSWNSEPLTDIGGLRFVLNVPKDATILSAIITADILASPWDNPRLDIKAEQADDPVTFSAADNLVDRWPAGGPSVAWIAGELGAGAAALPDIATVLQPIVERAGWASGQHAAILLRGRGDFITGVRFTSWDGDPDLAATLAVTYIVSVPPVNLVGSYTPIVNLIGSHTPTKNLVGSHTPIVEGVGSDTPIVNLVGSHTPIVELEGSWDE